LRAIDGIEEFIFPSEVASLLDPIIKVIAYGADAGFRKEAREYLEIAFIRTPNGNDHAWRKRLDEWISHFKRGGREPQAEIILNLRSQAEDVPF